MSNRTSMRAMAVVFSLAAFGWSQAGLAGGEHGGGGGGRGGGGGGGHFGGGGHGGGGHFGGGGGRVGYAGRGGSGFYRGGHGGYGGRGGYGYGGWALGGIGLGLGLGLGLYYASLPYGYATYWDTDGSPYYYANDNYYQWDGSANEYETVSPPPDVQRQSAIQSPKLIAYPKNGQSAAQQAADETACRTWAASQMGVTAAQGTANGSSNSDYNRAQTACLEGRGYSVQ